MLKFFKKEQAFTLIELLVVIAILAVLAVAVTLVLNPAELIRQARDSTRLSDMASVDKALLFYQTDQIGTGSYGSSDTIYISLPDTSDTCANHTLPSLPFGWNYHCVQSSNSFKVDGTGWIPVNLTGISFSSPLSRYPLDPVNEDDYYYAYVAGSWYLEAPMESVRKQDEEGMVYELNSTDSISDTVPDNFKDRFSGSFCNDGECNGDENCSSCSADCSCVAGKECFAETCVSSWASCGDTLYYGDDSYSTVFIGSQCWFAENLNVTDGNEDGSCTFTRYCYGDTSSNCDTYGGLYTWDNAMCGEASSNFEPSGVQGICPNGWHIPSHYELVTLERQICSDIGNINCDTTFPKDVSTTGWLGQNTTTAEGEGSAMAGNEVLWTDGNIDNSGAGNNDFGTSGLSALPAGFRYTDGSYGILGYYTYLWSSTESGSSNVWSRNLDYNHTDVYRIYIIKDYGFSVRCLRD